MSEVTFLCEHIGVSGTTPCHVSKTVEDGTSDVYEARIGIALIGATNMDEAGFKAALYNPFHEKFYDNYAHGFGATKEEAIENMKKDMRDLSESLFV